MNKTENASRGANYVRTIKENIDSIYSLTKPPYVFTETWKQFNSRSLEETVTALVKRGVLLKKTAYKGNKKGTSYTFTWNSSMAPTNTLVKNIVEDIRKKRREKEARCRELHNHKEYIRPIEIRNELVVPEEANIAEGVETFAVIYKNKLTEYSSQELWNELKSRGFIIENNSLVKITKEVLE